MFAKFQDHRTSGTGIKVLKVFTMYGLDGQLGYITWIIYTNFRSPLKAPHEYGFHWPISFGDL